MNDFFRNLSFYLGLPHSYEGGICRVSLKSESVNDDSCGDATLEPLNEMRGRCGADGCRMRGRWVPKGHQFAPQGSPWGAKGLHMAPHGEPNGSTWLPMGSQTAPLGPPWGAKRLHLAPQVGNWGPEGRQKAPLGDPRACEPQGLAPATTDSEAKPSKDQQIAKKTIGPKPYELEPRATTPRTSFKLPARARARASP